MQQGPNQGNTADKLEKKRAADRISQKKCFDKRMKTIADSLFDSKACIDFNEVSSNSVIEQIEAKDQAYNRFLQMLAKVQVFASESQNNNYYLQTYLSSVPCDFTAAQRQEMIQRVNTKPLTPAFTNSQRSGLSPKDSLPQQKEQDKSSENRTTLQHK